MKNIADKAKKVTKSRRLKAFLVEHELKSMDVKKLQLLKKQTLLQRKFGNIIDYFDSGDDFISPELGRLTSFKNLS